MMKNEDKKPLIIIAGATAVGKTELSVELAKTIGGEIISADSMQVYRGMDIGTAKITRNEMKDVPHYMIDILDPNEDFNVYEFQRFAKEYLQTIYHNDHIPILVGGTGFYIQSLLYDIDFSSEENDKQYRNELELLAEEKGNSYLHDLLKEVDFSAAEQIHPNNRKRVIRALEFFHETGTRISTHNEEQSQKESPYNYVYFVLNRNRDTIYKRINKRVDKMFEDGLIREVSHLLESGTNEDALSMQGLGYKEVIPYLKGMCSLEEAKELLKQNTRHFAKRQITWFKREKDTIWLSYEDFDNTQKMLENIVKIIKEKKIV